MYDNVRLTVLQDITDDTELVKVPATTFRTEGLLERDLDVANGVLVPSSAHGNVGETQDENVLDHLLPEVVIDTEGLIF